MRTAIATAVLALATASQAADKQANDPQGSWERKASSGPPATTERSLTMKDGRFRWYFPDLWKGTREKGTTVSVTLEGDYSVTKDSIVYGIVTKVTLTHSGGTPKPTGFPEEDDTFSFRFRVDDNEMNIRGLKGKGFEELKTGEGRYWRKPTPEKTKPKGK
jgi:hypothetical protein